MDRSSQSPSVGQSGPRRSLYPEIDAYAFGWLPTGGPHEIYYEECGNPKGKAALVLHGGPGGAINPTMRRFFHPEKWRVALFDQRGSRKSRPNASLEDNTTWSLIEDIERLRVHLGVEKWTVFGGSWGSTLAIAYAITHPDRVEGLILRGIFLLTERELKWFYQDGASYLFPDAWEKVKAQAAAAWSQWEGDTISIRGPEARPPKFNEVDFAIAFARIECHFFANRGFFQEDGWLLKNVDKIRKIPGWIVQGRFDVVTPLETAWALHKAWPEAKFDIVWDAGHASTEPGVIDGLIRATDEAARR